MSVFSGPEIPNNGLVFYYDSNNIQKSWKGIPTTNLTLNNSFYSNWTNSGTGTWNANDTTIPRLFSEYELLSLLVTTDGNLHISCGRSNISAGQTYTVSVYFYIPSSARTLAGSPPYIRTDPANTSRGGLAYNGDTNWNNWPRDTWIRVTQTFTNTANDTALYISCYLNTTNNKIYMTVPTVENIGFMTPFVGGAGITRSNTQAILDLTNNNTLIANGLSYAANNTFSFNGITDRIYTSTNTTYGSNTTWEAWVLRTSSLNTYNMFMGRYLPYFGIMSDNKIIFSNRVGGSQQTIYSTGFSAVNNTWYHLAFSTEYDGTTNTTARIYINGVLNNSALQTGAHTQEVERFTIGTWYSTDTAYPFQGKVDSVKVYNRTLSAREIRQNFEATRSRYGI